MLFAAILSICASSSKLISIYNEEIIVVLYIIGFIIFIRKSLVESLPTARCVPKCEKTVQTLLCRNLNVKSATLSSATSDCHIRLQNDIAIKLHFLVGKRFFP
ncbi:hypothetical protein R3W88_004348 [Solanum pinnatisectum]|uniref:ATP synthase protein MI25 n=1 Tax=Solanum pinnatisectum TaxID=50273 RepID=A0AAV9KBF6_9SOLN|nr:hypothetical protein R3W88_004348 [Solanum pinnatisectum]